MDASAWEPLEETEWRKFNWDTGCATTVFPRKEFSELDSAKDQVNCRTASGEVVTASGRIIVKGGDEHGRQRRVKGRLADVHKTLVSAGEVAVQGYDGWVGSDGGYLMPRTGKIAEGLRQEFARVVKRHGEADLLPLYLEQGVYNFYLRGDAGSAELAPLDQPPPSGNGRRAQQP